MPKKLLQFIGALYGLTLMACNSGGQDSTLESFKEVDKTLSSSANSISKSLNGLYAEIKDNDVAGGNISIKADTVFYSHRTIQNYIDSLTNLLLAQDATGESLNVSTNLFIKEKAGDLLYNKLLEFNRYTESIIQGSVTLGTVGSELGNIDRYESEEWTKSYFNQVPTVAAVTLLNKFQLDCSIAATNALTYLKEKLDKGHGL